MQFDNTINLGTLLTAVVFFIGLWKMNNNIVSKLSELMTKMEVLWSVYLNEGTKYDR